MRRFEPKYPNGRNFGEDYTASNDDCLECNHSTSCRVSTDSVENINRGAPSYLFDGKIDVPFMGKPPEELDMSKPVPTERCNGCGRVFLKEAPHPPAAVELSKAPSGPELIAIRQNGGVLCFSVDLQELKSAIVDYEDWVDSMSNPLSA